MDENKRTLGSILIALISIIQSEYFAKYGHIVQHTETLKTFSFIEHHSPSIARVIDDLKYLAFKKTIRTSHFVDPIFFRTIYSLRLLIKQIFRYGMLIPPKFYVKLSTSVITHCPENCKFEDNIINTYPFYGAIFIISVRFVI